MLDFFYANRSSMVSTFYENRFTNQSLGFLGTNIDFPMVDDCACMHIMTTDPEKMSNLVRKCCLVHYTLRCTLSLDFSSWMEWSCEITWFWYQPGHTSTV